ncbi:hypothetical protein ACN47E_007706 [Coniothyrium glycines]
MSPRFGAGVAGVVALLAVFYALIPRVSFLQSSLCTSQCLPDANRMHTGSLEYECAGKPHHSTWSSWWHPERSEGTLKDSAQGAGAITKDWNILYHLGGNGPWVEKVIDVTDGGIAVPENCVVEQVHMMSRHAERYPTVNAGLGQRAVVERMKGSGNIFNGSLAFFNDWELFWSDDADLEQLTTTGPFAGTLGAFTTGIRLRTRYEHLRTQALTRKVDQPTTFWASDSNRVIETARHFASGFFGIDYDQNTLAALQVISEGPEVGANTLTPGRTCLASKKDHVQGRRKGYDVMGLYRATYLRAIRGRLLEQTGMQFSDQEVYAMQEMCGFETTVRGRSDWCNVFTQEDFLSFEYARDLLHYYRAGPGQKYAASMGWLWLNATTNLMLEGAAAGPLFFSFVHDGDIAPMMTALNIINDKEHLPITHIAHDRKWRKSQVAPMGGRIIFELLSCRASSDAEPEKFVRININDGITAIPDCKDGPGESCPLAAFAARTKKRGQEVGDFRELCGLNDDAADRITFLHQ